MLPLERTSVEVPEHFGNDSVVTLYINTIRINIIIVIYYYFCSKTFNLQVPTVGPKIPVVTMRNLGLSFSTRLLERLTGRKKILSQA